MTAKIMEVASFPKRIHIVIKDENREEYHKVSLTARLVMKLIYEGALFSIKRQDPRSPDLLISTRGYDD